MKNSCDFILAHYFIRLASPPFSGFVLISDCRNCLPSHKLHCLAMSAKGVARKARVTFSFFQFYYKTKTTVEDSH